MPPLSYVERLKIAWFLWWRIIVTSFFVNLGLATVLVLVGAPLGLRQDTIVGVGYFLGLAFAILLITPWVLGMLPHKQFEGFRIEVTRIRDGQT